METEPILETAIRKARSLLWANWPSVHNLTDAETVARLSDIISSSAVMWALRRSDTFFAFVLRAITKIKARLIGSLDPDDWDLPPKPKWMRWRTYNRYVERYDAYEDVLNSGIVDFAAKFMGRF
jgi:hypothetical protein